MLPLPPRPTLFPYTTLFRSDPTAIKRFLREAGYGARVQHPGVVRTYDYGETEGLHYLALEWADGKSLRSEEHTSELQSHSDLVCRLLLEKKKGHLVRANGKR